jgi:TPP-dependent pyruvate/acetoin dehydrogenase alpha subunit
MFDPELYRAKEEVENWKKRDPIALLVSRMREQSLVNEEDVAAIETDVAAEVDDAVAFADAGTLEPIDELTRFVYSERQRRTS